MAGTGLLTDLLLVVISFIAAVLGAFLVKNIMGNYGIAIIFLIVLFFFLYAVAAMRGWTLPFTVRFVHSSLLSEVFLTGCHYIRTGCVLVPGYHDQPCRLRCRRDLLGPGHLWHCHARSISIKKLAVIFSAVTGRVNGCPGSFLVPAEKLLREQ